MKEIKINFVDFWPDLKKENNYFYNILKEYYNVVIDTVDPDILFFSLFGYEHLKYNCKKIFFSGESVKPNYLNCDFAFSFDYTNNINHFRLPLFSLYIDDFNLKDTIEKVQPIKQLKLNWEKKNKFCAMVVSNPRATERINFFKKLSKIKQVDSGGKILNNVGGRVKNKMKFINNYKFVMAFENEIHDGYTTEKILEPILMNCIPIYWGNKYIHKDFNPKRFINYHDFESDSQLFERLLEIENNPKLALEIISQPIFSSERIKYLDERKEVFKCIKRIVESKKTPVSRGFKGLMYKMNIKFKSLQKRMKKLVNYKL